MDFCSVGTASRCLLNPLYGDSRPFGYNLSILETLNPFQRQIYLSGKLYNQILNDNVKVSLQ